MRVAIESPLDSRSDQRRTRTRQLRFFVLVLYMFALYVLLFYFYPSLLKKPWHMAYLLPALVDCAYQGYRHCAFFFLRGDARSKSANEYIYHVVCAFLRCNLDTSAAHLLDLW